ncbi:AraC family transcriptional regulator ligand-binding domain-containing protein [Nocardia sp. NPDC052001]|uniref:AraC family transcriptional regulator n=1 Tax=Nocardia sp. NPDC052001 TaxID=3154853 RepID=UPI0034235C54
MGRTLPIQFVRATVEAAARRDLDIGAALHTAGLTWEMYGNDRARVLPEQASKVAQALWEQTNDELLGLGPQPVPRGVLRMLGLSVIHCADLRAALSRMTEFAALSTGLRATITVADPGVVRVEFPDPPRHRLDPFVIFAVLTGLHRFATWLIRRPIPLHSVEFPFSAEHLAEEYGIVFGIRPTFGAPRAALSFDAGHLTEPVVRTEQELKIFLRDAPGSLVFHQGATYTNTSRVRKILERNPSAEWLSADEVARRLSISPPHLRRLLRAEGTSFRTLQEEILRDRAIESLVRGEESIADLAARLGYSEPRAFRRAFLRWTGSTPTDYRSAALPH